MSVVLEGRSQAETARLFGVSKGWVSKLVARYRAEGDGAYEPQSRRPHTSPARLDEPTAKAIIELRTALTRQGLDAGPETIHWHLNHHHETTVSVSTIRRRLVEAGMITPQPRKRPRSSYIRFEADLPNETWQTDFTHYRLNDGTDTEVLTWLDDHSRTALSVTAHTRVTGTIVVNTFTKAAETHGFPASVLSDNAMVYTTRFSGGTGGRNALETTLAALGVEQKHSRPNHPTTCGKVERFQQTLKKWLRAQTQPNTIDQLQELLDAFVDEYNNRRPHQSTGRTTPLVAYTRLPKIGPGGSTAGTHYRIRHDRVDDTGCVSLRRAGRMHHIGIGRAHTRTPVVLLIEDLDIRVIATQTGEVLRTLTLDPNRGYQPRHK